MPAVTVDLTPDLARIVERALAEGDYASANDVVAESLRRFERDLDENEAKLERLRKALDVGLADFEAGRYREYYPGMIDDIAAEIRSRDRT